MGIRKLPHLRALLCFEAVTDYQSFSSAAISLNLTHGAISHQVRSLEDWLGTQLFNRHNNGVRLTDSGLRLKNVCQIAFEQLELECNKIRYDGLATTLTIGCSSSFLAHWLLPRLNEFNDSASKALLKFDTQADFKSLLGGQVDFLISGNIPDHGGKIEKHLFANDVIGPVCKPSFAGRTDDPEKILGSSLLHAKSRPAAWQDWAQGINCPTSPTSGHVFETLSLSIEAAQAGFGYAIAPELVVRDELKNDMLVAPFGFIKSYQATFLYNRTNKPLSQSALSFREWLLTQAQEPLG